MAKKTGSTGKEKDILTELAHSIGLTQGIFIIPIKDKKSGNKTSSKKQTNTKQK